MSAPLIKNAPPPAPPRIVAVSGIVFAALYIASVVLIRVAVPADPAESGTWLGDVVLRNWVRFALHLIPFTGIAFLWFMAVLRNRIGLQEDRFFATVFLGSGLLFVATLFVAAAVAQGLVGTFAAEGRHADQSETYAVGRAMAFVLMNLFGAKMAAVFIIVTSSISLRTAILPRWIAILGYLLAFAMLLTISNFAWIGLVFPSWVLVVSAYILIADFGRDKGAIER